MIDFVFAAVPVDVVVVVVESVESEFVEFAVDSNILGW